MGATMAPAGAGAARWQFGHVWQGPRRALAGRWDSFGGQARSRGQRLGYVMSAVAGQGVLLHEEGTEGILEGGDRIGSALKGGLKMRQDLCRCCPARGHNRHRGRQLGRRAAAAQRRADRALCQVEPFPQTLPGPDAAAAILQPAGAVVRDAGSLAGVPGPVCGSGSVGASDR